MEAPFEVLPGVMLGAGAGTSFGYRAVSIGLSPSRPLSGEVVLRGGGFYEGRLSEQRISATWRPQARWSVGASLGRQRVGTTGARFTARSGALRLEHTPDARTAHVLVLQHDNVSLQSALALRSRFQLAQGREVRLALDRSRTGLADAFAPGASQAPDDWRATASMRWTFER